MPSYTPDGSRVFSRLKGKAKSCGKIAVVDIETWGLDARPEAFAIGVIFDGREYIRFTKLEDLRNCLTGRRWRGYIIYAHNGGGYDFKCIFGVDFLAKMGAMYKGNRLIEAKHDDHGHITRFRDSLALFPESSIASLGQAVGLDKLDGSKFHSGKHCEIEEKDWTYCERDCQILYKAIEGFASLTGELRCTIASTAMSVFRRGYLKEDVYVHERHDFEFRKAYYGGRVQVFKFGKLPGNEVYDVNSLYPWSMCQRFPNPDHLQKWDNVGVHEFIRLLGTKEGMAHVRLTHLDSQYGYLPVRNDDGKLEFPTGELIGWWCFPELRAALAAGVIRIHEVYSVIFSEGMDSPLTEYVEHYYDLKARSSGMLRTTCKYLLNALYGKFGEYRDKDEIYADEYSVEKHKELIKEFGENVDWIRYSLEGKNGHYKITKGGAKPSDCIPTHAIYCFAAYITSHSRARMLDYMARSGEVFYMDTDSLAVTSMPPELVGGGLGLMKDEGYGIAILHGKKDYVSTKGVTKLKGVKRGTPIVDNTATFTTIASYKHAFRRGITPGTPVSITKVLRRPVSDPTPYIDMTEQDFRELEHPDYNPPIVSAEDEDKFDYESVDHEVYGRTGKKYRQRELARDLRVL